MVKKGKEEREACLKWLKKWSRKEKNAWAEFISLPIYLQVTLSIKAYFLMRICFWLLYIPSPSFIRDFRLISPLSRKHATL